MCCIVICMATRGRKPQPEPTDKTCKTCGETKTISEFARSGRKYTNRYGVTRNYHRPDCKECFNLTNQPRTPEYRNQARAKKYGLTIEQITELVESPCAICKGPGEHVDHCHTTGRVRGHLCRSCNHMLGNAKDDPALLLAAVAYLAARLPAPGDPA